MIQRPKATRTEKIQLVLSILVLLVFIAGLFWVSYEVRDIKVKFENQLQDTVQSFASKAAQESQMKIVHEEVVTTLPADKPRDPKEPREPRDVTDEQVSKAVDNYMQQHPTIVGDDDLAKIVQDYFVKNPVPQGEIGPVGLTVFVRKNPLTMMPECKVANDFSWQPLDSCL